MNNNRYMAKIKDLKINYIIQLILNIIVIVFNFVIKIEIFWQYSLFYYLYLSLIIFGIFYFLIPIGLFSYILLKKLNQKSIKICKIISFTFCVLVVITGLGFIIILMMNALETTDYCRECPFNLQNAYVNNIYDKYIENNIKDKELKKFCASRRCIFNNENLNNKYPYEYICNYDPTPEFDEIKNKTSNETLSQIECNQIDKKNNQNIYGYQEISKFISMCNSYNEFFMCKRLYKPISYSLAIDFECPNNNYFSILLIFCLASVILNLIISFIPWRLEYLKYKNLIIILRQINIRNESKSLNSTQNNSKVKKNNNAEKEESFKKEPTEIISVYTEAGEKMDVDQNFSFDNNNIENNAEDNNNIKLKINKIIPKKEELNNDNIFTINKKNNSYEIINQKEKINKVKNNIIEKKNSKESKKEASNLKKKKNKDNLIFFLRKKEVKKSNKEIQKVFVHSNSQIISYNSERNLWEETKNIPKIKNDNN